MSGKSYAADAVRFPAVKKAPVEDSGNDAQEKMLSAVARSPRLNIQAAKIKNNECFIRSNISQSQI